MGREYRYTASDKKAGMSFGELEDAVKEVGKFVEDGYRYRLKARLGWRNQILEITFTETDLEAASGLLPGETI